MKKLFITLAAMVAVATACLGASGAGLARGPVNDLALIYQGGAHRIAWTEDEIEPYVTHRFADSSEQWLFDGFLFLEFKDGRGRQFSPGYDSLNATRNDWLSYAATLFAPDRALHALDRVIGRKKAELGDPGFRHRIVLTLLVPIPGQKDWGELNGRSLDFDNRADQREAIVWFADTLRRRFESEHFENIDLHGFYWIDEDMVATRDLTADIAPELHSHGLLFYWIPYFKAPGHERWRELGFDIAYHQPNHFFQDHIPDSRLDEAVDEAEACGMAMEFETDERALSQDPLSASFRPRMESYIDSFIRRGVFDTASVAYYTGNHLLLDMRRQPSEPNQAITDRLARIIVGRRAAK